MANTSGGGAKTNQNGLQFERETNLKKALENKRFVVKSISKYISEVYLKDKKIGIVISKNGFYQHFDLLKKENQEPIWKKYISKKLYPDDAFINFIDETLYIIEKKYQGGGGSVDEKLQTFQFKIYEFKKFLPIMTGIESIKYYYVTNDFFDNEKYKDIKEYIKLNGSDIFIKVIPLDKMGLDNFDVEDVE